MKRINEDLVRNLAYEERLVLYRIAQNHDIEEGETFGVLHMVEDLTKVNLTAHDFDFEAIAALGIDNCCSYFKALCEQYLEFKTNGEDGEFLAHQKRFNVVMGDEFRQVKTRIVDIGLYSCAKVIDDTIDDNYDELIHGSMSGNDVDIVRRYALVSAFADMYYAIRDYIEGKSYYDGQFMTEYRELGDDYLRYSHGLLDAYMRREKISSKEEAKNALMVLLNEGVIALGKIPFQARPALEGKKIGK